MSRSGYSDDYGEDESSQWASIRWRGAVTSSIRGKRGQAFLIELAEALDSLPEKKLIEGDLERGGAVCAIGAVGRVRGVDMNSIDPEDSEKVAGVFGIAPTLAREVVYVNDECGRREETEEERFIRVRKWVQSRIKSLGTPKKEEKKDV